MQSIAIYKEQIADYLNSIQLEGQPIELYEPISYILSLGGKQIRPVLTLMAADVFNEDPKKLFMRQQRLSCFTTFL